MSIIGITLLIAATLLVLTLFRWSFCSFIDDFTDFGASSPTLLTCAGAVILSLFLFPIMGTMWYFDEVRPDRSEKRKRRSEAAGRLVARVIGGKGAVK